MDSCITKKEQTREGMARNRREATRRVGNLFFEMSRPVESPEMLKSWVEWFRRLHIPCAIARTEAGYTLWEREGGGTKEVESSIRAHGHRLFVRIHRERPEPAERNRARKG